MAKRVFWQDVTIEVGPEGAYGVMLDKRALVLPGGTPLIVRSRVLADVIAAEWRALTKGEVFHQDALPLTQLVATQLERVLGNRPDVVRALTRVFTSDALLFRDGTSALGLAQSQLYALPREKFEHDLGVRLPWTDALTPPELEADVMDRVSASFHTFCDATLTGMSVISSATASAVLAYAVVKGYLSPELAAEIACIEENAQMARWGRDESLIAAQSQLSNDAKMVQRFLSLTSGVARQNPPR